MSIAYKDCVEIFSSPSSITITNEQCESIAKYFLSRIAPSSERAYDSEKEQRFLNDTKLTTGVISLPSTDVSCKILKRDTPEAKYLCEALGPQLCNNIVQMERLKMLTVAMQYMPVLDKARSDIQILMNQGPNMSVVALHNEPGRFHAEFDTALRTLDSDYRSAINILNRYIIGLVKNEDWIVTQF